MCDICQLQFRFDHEATADEGGVPCPRCGRFYVDPEQETCYHCYAEESLNETCDLCVVEHAPRGVALN